MKNESIEEIEKMLIDNDEIVYGKGTAETIEFCCRKSNYNMADILIYLNTDNEIAVIWNLKRQREYKHIIKTQSLNCSWNNVLPEKDEIKDWYKQMGRKLTNPYEKVIAMSFNTLIANINNLYQLLKFDIEDTDIPQKLINEENMTNQPRTKITVERWNRDIRFRKKVLNEYGNQCAICRCSEIKILEAAHIKAVSEGGFDTKENGICLCRNHHAMLDKRLIGIDFENQKLTYISDSVKSMSWFSEFVKKYDERILSAYKGK